jgi:rubredoxin
MKSKYYIHDFNDNIFKRMVEEYTCIDCGLIQNDNDMDKWEKIDDKIICPECNRKKKMKKIKELIYNSI